MSKKCSPYYILNNFECKIRVTYLINKSFIVVHREHGVLPVRLGAGCPLTPLVLAAMVRQEAKAQGLSPTLNSEWVLVIVCESQRKKKGQRQSQLLCWAISPTLSSPQPLSSAALPMLEYGNSLTPKAPQTQHENKSRELSTAPTLPLPLPLPPTAFIQGSIKCF